MKNSGIVITKELFPAEHCDAIIDVYEETVQTQPVYVHQSSNDGYDLMNRNDSFMCLDEIVGWNEPKINLPRLVNEHLTKALR